jgi:queuine tRNA-ribosyltransferase
VTTSTSTTAIPFELLSTDGSARRGRLTTTSGVIDTPQFMPVGTCGSVKGVDCERLAETSAQVMLVNTYHLWLRPGEERIRELGGIHKFSGWKGSILSDSGGYQVFSLQKIRTIAEEGVSFRSHIDGAKKFLSPEGAIAIQETLGVDIAMVLDECPSFELSYDQVARSVDLTCRWASRCFSARQRRETAVFAITQGAGYSDIRRSCIQRLAELPFDGFAIGGLSVGEPKEEMYRVLNEHVGELPEMRPRYLMGVGTPGDIVEAVKNGIDMFDCVMPTRSGRFGRAFVNGERPYINIRNSQFAGKTDPLDADCSCIACRNYSCGYIHHLFKAKEMLGPQLLSVHNLTHYLALMQRIRLAIEEKRFAELYKDEMSRWQDI